MILDTDEDILEKANQYTDALSSLERELPDVISHLDVIRNTEIVKLNFSIHYFNINRIELCCTVVDFSNLPESYKKVLNVLKDIIETKGAYITFY